VESIIHHVLISMRHSQVTRWGAGIVLKGRVRNLRLISPSPASPRPCLSTSNSTRSMPSARPASSRARRMRAGAYYDGGLSSVSLDLDSNSTHEPVSLRMAARAVEFALAWERLPISSASTSMPALSWAFFVAAARARHLVRGQIPLVPHHVFKIADLAFADEKTELPGVGEIVLRSKQRHRCQSVIAAVAQHSPRPN
jgi:hypothetical protein